MHGVILVLRLAAGTGTCDPGPMTMTMPLVVLFIVSAWAGVQNALAGGGTFLTLPTLIITGMNAQAANITSTVGLFPAQLVTGLTGRKNVAGAAGLSFRALMLISLAGGAVGAVLLLVTPSRFFAILVPWLVLFATVMFACGSYLPKYMPRIGGFGAGVAQFLIAVYGGYFGGGIGFLMLAAGGGCGHVDPRIRCQQEYAGGGDQCLGGGHLPFLATASLDAGRDHDPGIGGRRLSGRHHGQQGQSKGSPPFCCAAGHRPDHWPFLESALILVGRCTDPAPPSGAERLEGGDAVARSGVCAPRGFAARLGASSSGTVSLAKKT